MLHMAVNSHHNIIKEQKHDIIKDLFFSYNNIINVLTFKI